MEQHGIGFPVKFRPCIRACHGAYTPYYKVPLILFQLKSIRKGFSMVLLMVNIIEYRGQRIRGADKIEIFRFEKQWIRSLI